MSEAASTGNIRIQELLKTEKPQDSDLPFASGETELAGRVINEMYQAFDEAKQHQNRIIRVFRKDVLNKENNKVENRGLFIDFGNEGHVQYAVNFLDQLDKMRRDIRASKRIPEFLDNAIKSPSNKEPKKDE